MSITLVNSTLVTESEASSFNIAIPSWGQQNDDLWLLFMAKDDDPNIGIDAEFTTQFAQSSIASRDSRHEIAYRVHDGTETGPWAITQDTETTKYILSLWRGVDTVDPFDSVLFDSLAYANKSDNPVSGATLGAPNTADNVLIAYCGGNDATTINLTKPTGMTLVEGSLSTSISIPYIYVAYEQLSGSSAPGGRTWVDAGAAADGLTAAFYLRAAEGAGAGRLACMAGPGQVLLTG